MVPNPADGLVGVMLRRRLFAGQGDYEVGIVRSAFFVVLLHAKPGVIFAADVGDQVVQLLIGQLRLRIFLALPSSLQIR